MEEMPVLNAPDQNEPAVASNSTAQPEKVERKIEKEEEREGVNDPILEMENFLSSFRARINKVSLRDLDRPDSSLSLLCALRSHNAKRRIMTKQVPL